MLRLLFVPSFPSAPHKKLAIAAAILAALAPAYADEPPGPTVITADKVEGQTDQEITATGHAVIKRGGQQLEADWVKLFQPTQEIRAGDKTRLTQKNDVLEGRTLYLKDDTRVGSLDAPVYSLGKHHGRGDAVTLLFEGPDKYRLKSARYTTCDPGNDDWYVRAGDMELDYTRNVGVAHNASFLFKGVPFLYAPWLDFSLDGSRKSGFLAPSVGSTSSGGLEFTAPYYWNIAPNMDATFAPRVISKRGILLNNEFRYLNPSYAGQLVAEVIDKDRVFGASRNALSWQHHQALGPGLVADLNLQRASDDNYFSDFGDRIAVASTTYLPREASLVYTQIPGVVATLRTQRYQTLQNLDNPVGVPYARLPQLLASLNPAPIGPLRADMQTEAVWFRHPTQVGGQRYTAYPSVQMPLTTAYGFITPKVGEHVTRYSLDDGRSLSRSVPVISVDSGLFFDRELNIGGQDLIQSLEPRLFYVRIPYRDQSQLPNFDSAITDFNFAQMFSENQFSGGDRINDANQLTAALTSRLFSADDGSERLRVALGQRFYFTSPRVYLNSPGDSGGDINASDLIASVGGQPTEDWWVDSATQYSRAESRLQKAALSVRYQPRPNSVLNLRYRLDRLTDIKQVDISTQWPLSNRWYGIARENWSIRDHRSLEGLGGLEYNGGCWVFRVMLQRFVTPANTTTSAFFLQLELNDLGRLGSNPLETLRQSIPGYSKLNQSR